MNKKIKNRMPDNVKFVLEEINSNILRNYITNLQELCDKYEEEHNNTFKEWQKDMLMNKATIKDVEKYKSRCEKAIEFINGYKDMVGLTGNLVLNLLYILEGKDEYNK